MTSVLNFFVEERRKIDDRHHPEICVVCLVDSSRLESSQADSHALEERESVASLLLQRVRQQSSLSSLDWFFLSPEPKEESNHSPTLRENPLRSQLTERMVRTAVERESW